jgi:hypothetical protein
MINDTKLTDAVQDYATAYNEHYTTKDLHKAFGLYESLIEAHPDSLEAGYSRSQIQNIVNTVVPKQKVMDVLAELALTYLEQGVPPEAEVA